MGFLDVLKGVNVGLRRSKGGGGKYNCHKIHEKQIKYFCNMKILVYLPIVLQVSL
jgi:hypothetical protein